MDASLIPAIRTLGRFCGVRDIPAPTPEALRAKTGLDKADVMVLFGGSILCGGDVLARAMQSGAAKRYAIVGGCGHTTQSLRDAMRAAFPGWETADLPEAVLFSGYLQRRYGLAADLLECRSTNCGNNITFLLELLDRERIPLSACILTQDATMQRRMAAVLRRERPDVTAINYAAYDARVIEENGEAVFRDPPPGMWDMKRYVTLLTGEIPRLRDDESGYGPRGKGYLAHEDIPEAVEAAYRTLKACDASLVRGANAAFRGPGAHALPYQASRK